MIVTLPFTLLLFDFCRCGGRNVRARIGAR